MFAGAGSAFPSLGDIHVAVFHPPFPPPQDFLSLRACFLICISLALCCILSHFLRMAFQFTNTPFSCVCLLWGPSLGVEALGWGPYVFSLILEAPLLLSLQQEIERSYRNQIQVTGRRTHLAGYFILFLFLFVLGPPHTACGILVPRSGIEPEPLQ